jgi:hypothetical protein
MCTAGSTSGMANHIHCYYGPFCTASDSAARNTAPRYAVHLALKGWAIVKAAYFMPASTWRHVTGRAIG